MISKRIWTLLQQKQMTRADLARATGIPYHRLNPWFTRDGAKPNGPDLERVASYLGVSVRYLVYGDEPNPASARDWIADQYQQLDPEKQKQLEGFVQFLLAQQSNQGKPPGGSGSDH